MKKYIKPSIDIKEINVETLLADVSNGTGQSINETLSDDPITDESSILSRGSGNYSVWDD